MEMPQIADAARGLRHVFIRDLTMQASIGVHAHEQRAPQRVRISVDLGVAEDGPPVGHDELGRVVDYQRVADRVRAVVNSGHVRLAETLAERIAVACLEDARVIVIRVRVEKPDAFDDIASVGVEIERRRL